MIKCWRDAWGQGDFPFLVVQLAPFKQINKEPIESDWAELREAQLFTSQTVPNVGLAVITDVGDEKDIHPPAQARSRRAAGAGRQGDRLRQKIVYSGPIYDKLTVSGNKVILNFKHVGTGLVAKDGELTGLHDRRRGQEVLQRHAPKSRAKRSSSRAKSGRSQGRSLWLGQYPFVNLWNKDGLPACPFRTDDFPRSRKTPNNRAAARRAVVLSADETIKAMLKRLALGTCCSLSALLLWLAPRLRRKSRPNILVHRQRRPPARREAAGLGNHRPASEKVTVSFAGQEVSAEPADGKWQVELAPLAASDQPATLTITQGDTKVERKNILVGDVWVCGGQSNMRVDGQPIGRRRREPSPRPATTSCGCSPSIASASPSRRPTPIIGW